MTFTPTWLTDVELTQPLPTLCAPSSRYGQALVLARLFGRPVGMATIALADGQVEAGALAEVVTARLGASLDARLRAEGLDGTDTVPASGLRPRRTPAFLRDRQRFLEQAPPFASVVLCTRDGADRLRGTLPLVLGQSYPSFEVIVVDNASRTPAVRDLLETHFPHEPDLRYVLEPRPGLSAARNCGLQRARGDVVAYLDDDERPDRDWLLELMQGFGVAADVAAVSGMILPAELETQAQAWFEAFGGHSKGRGFATVIFDAEGRRAQSPLFPVPPFGAGGNMAFRRDTLLAAGGFDERLGAGTPVEGAEDTAAFLELMLREHTIVYQPSALVRHAHRRDLASLERQLFGYGAGLTAFYTRVVLAHPERIPELVGLIPKALRYFFGRGSLRTASMTGDYPRSLRSAQLRGMAAGPFAFLRSWLRTRRHTPPDRPRRASAA